MNEAFKFMKKMLKAPATPRTKPKQYTHTINEIDTTVKVSLYKQSIKKNDVVFNANFTIIPNHPVFKHESAINVTVKRDIKA